MCTSSIEDDIFRCSALTFFIATFDVALSIYNRYTGGDDGSHNTIAYAAHMGGAVAGFLVGMNALRNFHKLVSSRRKWQLAITFTQGQSGRAGYLN